MKFLIWDHFKGSIVKSGDVARAIRLTGMTVMQLLKEVTLANLMIDFVMAEGIR